MLSLLNPLALWLAPLAALPVLIHFLGRRQPKPRDFPSLMLVRGELSRAMRRHRVKNWLQLFLRTAAVLALIAGAGDPLWRPASGFAPPAAAGLLLHNGAYAALPLPGGTALEAQQRLRRGLDSITGGRTAVELLLPDAPLGTPSARLGGYAEALARLVRKAPDAASVHLVVPAFDWRDLEGAGGGVAEALRRNPALRFILVEFEGAGGLAPFRNPRLSLSRQGSASLEIDADGAALLWTPEGGTPREFPVAAGAAEIPVPPSRGGWWTGTLSPTTPGPYAFPEAPVSVRIPPPASVCHVASGAGAVSLASLGKEGWRRRLRAGRLESLGPDPCDVLVLSDPPGTDAAAARAAETLRRGGKVILVLGRAADPAFWNRNLLVPMGVGRLAALRRTAEKLRPDAQAFARLGMRASEWGEPGEVKAHLEFRPDSGTRNLITAGGFPILAHGRAGAGRILLWTTDIDDPEWTDAGLGPWPALIHQAFSAGGAEPELWLTGADSLWTLPASESDGLRVTDPGGAPFSRVRRDPSGWRIGPFDQPGLYRAAADGDTAVAAVVLDPRRVVPGGGEAARRRFLESLEETRPRVLLRPASAAAGLYGGLRLRLWVLALAALLLLAEGVVSLGLRPAPSASRA